MNSAASAVTASNKKTVTLSEETTREILMALETRIDFCKERAQETRPFPGEGLDADYWDANQAKAVKALAEFRAAL